MIARIFALSVILVVVVLSVGLSVDAEFTSAPVAEDSIEFVEDSYSPGETATFFIKDNDLATTDMCTATWAAISSDVTEDKWWNLGTGEPQADVHSLSAACAFDTASPSNTPLTPSPPPWTASVNGVPTFVDNFDPSQGSISLLTDVNASSTMAALFHFEVVDLYSASTTRARVTSESDSVGEWIALSEVRSEADLAPDASSSLFLGEVEISTDGSSQTPGDSIVWVQHGDSLTVTYFDSDGVSVIDWDSVPLNIPIPTATSTPLPPTATPTATATPVPPTATPTATATPVPPTATSTATATPAPPTATPTATATPLPPTATPTPLVCDFSGTAEPVIKGNINSNGEKIYHTPDSPNYTQTFIDESKGERWFCTVEEAEDAGWRLPLQLVPTPTPIPSAGPVALATLSGIFIVLILWRLRTRPLSANE